MTKLQIVCAWCGKPMGEKDGKGQEGVTSSICDVCYANYMPGLATKPKPDGRKKV